MTNEVELISESKFQDSARLKEGVIIRVNKYKRETAMRIPGSYIAPWNVPNGVKKVPGVKNGYETLREYRSSSYDRRAVVVPAGWIIIDGMAYERTINPNEFWVEISCAPGSFNAQMPNFKKLWSTIRDVLDDYIV